MKSPVKSAATDHVKPKRNNLIGYLVVGIILAIITYFPVFKAGFVNWDDNEYVVENITIQSPDNLHKILSEPVAGNFHPLTMLSLAVDYWISGGHAGWFHVINLLLHLVNIVLVFVFIYKLSGDKKWIAAITAVLFAIHPLHVESVAWISERKDLLYSAFFLGGLVAYLSYLKKGDWLTLTGVFVLFLLSLLSKPAAVVFPLVLLAVDYYFNRLGNTKTYLEKIPFFALSLLFGIITLHVQKAHGAYTAGDFFPFTSRFFFGNYGLLMYLVKMIAPVNLCAFYPYPAVNVRLPLIYYLSVLSTVALIVIFVISLKKNKVVAFSILFYVLNLILVLQFFAVGSAVMADRYSYLPLIGPFYLIGYGIQRYIDKNGGKFPWPGMIMAATVIVLLVILGIRQSATWKDGASLWDRAIKVCPSSKAYANRGMIYREEKNTREAMKMYSQAISMDRFATDALINRANIYFRQKRYRLAINDYSLCLAVEPRDDLALSNRGAAYLAIGMTDSATADLNLAIQINPETPNGYKNRGMLNLMTGRWQEAVNDFTRQLKITPDDTGELWSKIGYCYQQLGDHVHAVGALTRAIERMDDGYLYYLRAVSYMESGNLPMARDDIQQAVSRGIQPDPALLKALGMK